MVRNQRYNVIKEGIAMKKKDLMKLLECPTADPKIEAEAQRIKDILTFVPDETELGEIASIDEFAKRDGLRTTELAERDIVSELKTIIAELQTWIKRFVRKNMQITKMELDILDKGNDKVKPWRYIVLIAIAVLAFAAAIITTLMLVYGDDFLNGNGEKIITAIGVMDFVLGAVGIITEWVDDMKMKKVRSAVEEAEKTDDTEKLEKVYIKYFVNGDHNATGLFSKAEDNRKTMYK